MGRTLHNELTDQQIAFVVEYLRNGFNGAKAALSAGYSEATAPSQACQLLNNPKIAAEVIRRLEVEGITPERIKIALAEIAFDGDMEAFAGVVESGLSLKEAKKLGINTKLIQEYAVSPNKNGIARKVKVYSRLDALEKLAKIYAMFKDRVDVTSGGKPISTPGLTPEQYEQIAAAQGGPDKD